MKIYNANVQRREDVSLLFVKNKNIYGNDAFVTRPGDVIKIHGGSVMDRMFPRHLSNFYVPRHDKSTGKRQISFDEMYFLLLFLFFLKS